MALSCNPSKRYLSVLFTAFTFHLYLFLSRLSFITSWNLDKAKYSCLDSFTVGKSPHNLHFLSDSSVESSKEPQLSHWPPLAFDLQLGHIPSTYLSGKNCLQLLQ